MLIVTGDLTSSDKAYQFVEFFLWLDKQPYRKKVIIAGNHDQILQDIPPIPESLPDDVSYLCDSGTEFEGLKIWGSPWTTTFPGINPKTCAFTVDNDAQLMEKWNLIPDDIDILVTHSPSFGNLDVTKRGESVGSLSLWLACLAIRPKVHVFSHVHESYGNVVHHNGLRMVNCSIMNERYEPVNEPVRIVL